MNFRYLIEVGAWASTHARRLIDSPTPIPRPVLEAYWSSARTLLQTLSERLGLLTSGDAAVPITPQNPDWDDFREACDGILLTDVLVRVWSAILTVKHHSSTPAVDSGSRVLIRSILREQEEARHLVLSLMVDESRTSAPALILLDRTRRRCERWADLLLGSLVTNYASVREFCFDPVRAADFASDALRADGGSADRGVWNLLLTGLRVAFPGAPPRTRSLADSCSGLASSILTAFATAGDSAVESTETRLRRGAPVGSLLGEASAEEPLTNSLPKLPPLQPVHLGPLHDVGPRPSLN